MPDSYRPAPRDPAQAGVDAQIAGVKLLKASARSAPGRAAAHRAQLALSEEFEAAFDAASRVEDTSVSSPEMNAAVAALSPELLGRIYANFDGRKALNEGVVALEKDKPGLGRELVATFTAAGLQQMTSGIGALLNAMQTSEIYR